MTSLHMIFGLPPQSKILAAPMQGGGSISGRAPQITVCAPRTRTNFCASLRGPTNFCPKTGRHSRFFSVKLQHRSSERDQVA